MFRDVVLDTPVTVVGDSPARCTDLRRLSLGRVKSAVISFWTTLNWVSTLDS